MKYTKQLALGVLAATALGCTASDENRLMPKFGIVSPNEMDFPTASKTKPYFNDSKRVPTPLGDDPTIQTKTKKKVDYENWSTTDTEEDYSASQFAPVPANYEQRDEQPALNLPEQSLKARPNTDVSTTTNEHKLYATSK